MERTRREKYVYRNVKDITAAEIFQGTRQNNGLTRNTGARCKIDFLQGPRDFYHSRYFKITL